MNRGFTLLETLIGLAIFAIVSTAIFEAYGYVLQIVQSSQYNSAALNIIESRVEAVRNMRYEDIGVIGGIPSGALIASESVSAGTTPFILHTYVRNIDDPFDGTFGGSPADAAPADYKLVQFEITCADCPRYNVISLATYAAPKNLENASKRGELLINAIDASGFLIPGATVHVTNTHVSPAVNITDTTDADGRLLLVDVATSSAGYHIVLSKAGYSTDQTYPPGGTPANPVKPDATVAKQQLTIVSLSIDRVSTVTVQARDQFCAAVPSFDFLMTGTKLIGTSPDTPKYSVSHTTGGDGTVIVNNAEWDTYAFKPTDSSHAIAGAFSPLTMAINPNTAATQRWLAVPLLGDALSVAVVDAGGQPINDATVTLSSSGFSKSAMTGQASTGDSNWSGGAFTAASDLMNTDTPGILTLSSVDGIYATGSEQWLESRTFDLGTSNTTLLGLNYNPSGQPPQTTVRLQIAANNDNTTWNYVGQEEISGLSGNRYIRYKVFMETNDAQHAPSLDDVALSYRSDCIAPGAAYLDGLSNTPYTLTVSKSGYQTYSGSLTISGTWQEAAITLTQ
jgi:prepilin-type N-terminal cleavage/methylation domain-containing protein